MQGEARPLRANQRYLNNALRSILLVVPVFCLACADVLDFDVDQAVPEQVVQGSPLPAVLSGFFQLPLQIDIQSKIASHKTGPIDKILLKSLVLDVTATHEPAPDSDEWSFLTQADLYVESTKSGTKLAKVKVAAAKAPGNVRQLKFAPISGVNLVPYVNEGAQLTVQSSGNLPPDDTSFAGKAVFTVQPL